MIPARTWGARAFAGSMNAPEPDRIHNLPEQVIIGQGLRANLLPLAIGAGAVVLLLAVMGRK